MRVGTIVASNSTYSTTDIQAALDAGESPESPRARKTSFATPPQYDDTSPNTSPRPSLESINHRQHARQSAGFLSPDAAEGSYSPRSSTSSFGPNSPTPSILTQESLAIEFIRETLYASLADALERQPSLRRLLKRDPTRAYFASVAYAVLDVATHAISPDGSVIGVLGKPLTLTKCPPELRVFMSELAAIGLQSRDIEEEQPAMRLAERGKVTFSKCLVA